MEVTLFMLAPYGEVHKDGKVFMCSGDLDTLQVPSTFPATIGLPLYVLGKIKFQWSEGDRDYRTRIEIVAPDGAIIEKTDQILHPPIPDDPGRRSQAGFVLVLSGITLPMPGEYQFKLFIDDAEVKRFPIFVDQLPPKE